VEAVEQQIPAAEMERMMKAQEVILKAAAGKLKWWEAAEIMGVTDRTMRRWRERLNEHGYSGLWTTGSDGRVRKRVPMATVEKVLQLYREQCFDLNVRHFHERLQEVHGVELSYSWVKTALQTAGFVKKPGSHCNRRRGELSRWLALACDVQLIRRSPQRTRPVSRYVHPATPHVQLVTTNLAIAYYSKVFHTPSLGEALPRALCFGGNRTNSGLHLDSSCERIIPLQQAL
jgi:transposase